VVLEPETAAFQDWPKPPGDTGDNESIPEAWLSRLRPSFEFIRELLGVDVHPHADTLPKYQALAKLADALNRSSCRQGTRAELAPAPLAVTFEHGTNRVGVEQNQCTECGNCITGCNIGAKNHLAMNAWPLAKTWNVEIFTNASVESLERVEETGRWMVHGFLTNHSESRFQVEVRRLILAAGTLGSTEILLRSEKTDVLSFSKLLGHRFSTNGDALAFGYGQRTPVHGVANKASVAGDLEDADPRVGPTIVGTVRVQSSTRVLRTVEEGAIPFPLARLWGEMLATQGLFRRWSKPTSAADSRTAWHRDHPNQDPVALHPDLLSHSQTLLCMGMDEGDGRLCLKHSHRKDQPQYLELQWATRADRHEDATDQYYEALHRDLKVLEDHRGFDGGHYLPNALWKFFPDDFDGVAEGADKIGGHAITVHPLGGCPMGANAELGVVDAEGRVFKGKMGTDVHEGLYVLDGAIIPGPIGVNPLLTIAATAHHLALHMAKATLPETGWQPGKSAIEPESPPAADGYPIRDPKDQRVDLKFSEQMFGHLEGDNAGEISRWLFDKVPEKEKVDPKLLNHQTAKTAKRLVLKVSADIPDIFDWLADPGLDLQARFRLALNIDPNRADEPVDESIKTVFDDHLRYATGEMAGTLRLLAIDRPGCLVVRLVRAASAILKFLQIRGDEVCDMIKGSMRKELLGTPAGPGSPGLGAQLLGYLRAACIFTDWRTLDYRFEYRDGDGAVLSLRGSKRLAYACGEKNVWDALLHLPFELTLSRPRMPLVRAEGRLRVDMIHFTRDLAPFQATRSPDTPTTLLAMVGLGALFLRALVQTHFWSFGAPSYKGAFPDKTEANRDRLLDPPKSLTYQDKETGLAAVATCSIPEADLPERRLMRYQPQSPARASILLIHGFAHGSRVFWTETVETNLVQYLLGQGYDVWLLDHRLSACLPGMAERNATMDDVAGEDIPWAVRSVHAVTGHQVHVFAHCIGAGAFAMAVLKGKLAKMIASAALHAVTPWLVASEANRVRTNLVSALRDSLPFKYFDPVPSSEPTLWEVLIDRLASSIRWNPEDRQRHLADEMGRRLSRTACNRMTLFYGYEWNHANLDPRTHRDLTGLVGPGTVTLFKHIYYCVVRQRLTNHRGRHVYLTQQRLKNHWQFPTLFMHGKENKVFDPESSRLSAYMLAYSRVKPGDIQGWRAKPDFASRNVWFKHIPGYGHMDALFGRNAVQDTRARPSISTCPTRSLRKCIPISSIAPNGGGLIT